MGVAVCVYVYVCISYIFAKKKNNAAAATACTTTITTAITAEQKQIHFLSFKMYA